MEIACVSCGAQQPADARFCNRCGTPLYRQCPACGSDQPSAAAFCSACGTALQEVVHRVAVADERHERRVVTVLFADLAGSTALGGRLDPEEVRELQG
jgi:class 3 adenylate cyclase